MLNSTTDGFYIGYNVAQSQQIRLRECSDPMQRFDIRGNAARRIQLETMIKEKPVDLARAKEIISNHHDVYATDISGTSQDQGSSRSICGHLDRDDAQFGNHGWPPYFPWGANDGNLPRCPGNVVRGDLGQLLRAGIRPGRLLRQASAVRGIPLHGPPVASVVASVPSEVVRQRNQVSFAYTPLCRCANFLEGDSQWKRVRTFLSAWVDGCRRMKSFSRRGWAAFSGRSRPIWLGPLLSGRRCIR